MEVIKPYYLSYAILDEDQVEIEIFTKIFNQQKEIIIGRILEYGPIEGHINQDDFHEYLLTFFLLEIESNQDLLEKYNRLKEKYLNEQEKLFGALQEESS